MDENKRQLAILVVLGALGGGAFMAFGGFGVEEPVETAPVGADNTGAADTGATGDDTPADDATDDAPAPSEATAATALSADERALRLRAQRTATIETDDYTATFTDRNTALVSYVLRGEQWTDEEGEQLQLVTTDKERFLPLRVELKGIEVPADAVWQMEQPDPHTIRFTWSGDGFTVARRIEAGSTPFQLWSTVKVTNNSAGTRPVRVNHTTHHYLLRSLEDEGGFIGRPSPHLAQGICHLTEDTVRQDRSALEEGAQGHGPGVLFAGLENTYFGWMMAPEQGTGERCQISALDVGRVDDETEYGSLFEARLVASRQELAPGAEHVERVTIFIGPKDVDALNSVGHGMGAAVDLGWFTFIGKYLSMLLALIFGFIGNWGISIILLTVVVKAALFPLTNKSFKSMAKMRLLKPEMDELNERFKDDKEKKGAAVMELYRKHKVNPASGCLPSLLQIPIWFALYRSLSSNIELYHAPFAVWTDLSAPDPYYILPVLLGGLMFLQQKLTPTTMDPAQAKMMLYFMPGMMTVFMLFLPAGLCVYMVTNSALGISQQRYIHWRLDQQAPPPTPSAPEPDDPNQPALATAGAGSSSVKRRTKPSGKKSKKKRRG